MASEFKLPELGENVESGTILKILVSKGEEIAEEQTVMELETDKAVFEVPSDVGGVIKDILVKEGDEVKVGQKILELDSDGKQEKKVKTKEKENQEKKASADQEGEKAKDEQKEKPEEEKKEKETSEKKKSKPKGQGKAVDVNVPELGEGVESGTVAKVLVSAGDKIAKDDNILELETDKAVFELPSEVAGVIKEILVEDGDEVKVGQTIMKVAAEVSETEEVEPEEEIAREPEEEEEIEEAAPAKETAPEKPAGEKEKPSPPPPAEKREVAPAAPSVRRFAREIGIDIHEVPGSGPGGRISIDDVKNYSKMLNARKGAARAGMPGIEPEPLPDFSKWGEIDRQPMSNVRKKTARHLGYAWATIAHVTQMDKADITEVEKFRKEFGKKAEAAGGKLTVTAILLKIIASALKVFPQFNASIDMAKNEIIYKKYYNIGVAVDTDRGLLVPVIRDVDKKNIIELSVELGEVAKKARDRKLTLEEMQGGNFSISNLGGIGGTAFTPIVNSPEVAILGVSRTQVEPVYLNGQFEPRQMLPLSLSYDHRIIDGADAARFLRWVAEALEQPFRILLEG